MKKEATTPQKAGGGILHRGRGATAWGREERGDDAITAGGSNLHMGRGATALGREEGGKSSKVLNKQIKLQAIVKKLLFIPSPSKILGIAIVQLQLYPLPLSW